MLALSWRSLLSVDAVLCGLVWIALCVGDDCNKSHMQGQTHKVLPVLLKALEFLDFLLLSVREPFSSKGNAAGFEKCGELLANVFE